MSAISKFTQIQHDDVIENNLKYLKKFKDNMDLIRILQGPGSISGPHSTYFHDNDSQSQTVKHRWSLKVDNEARDRSSGSVVNNSSTSTAEVQNHTTYEDSEIGVSFEYPSELV